jgi:hypothetical protein
MIYLLNMSKGKDIKIDEDDLQKLKDNIKAPLIQLKQGIINPSFMISITPTDEPDVITKPQIEYVETDGHRMARIVGEDKIKLLADKMTNKNNQLQ